jgi:hypothetical protein
MAHRNCSERGGSPSCVMTWFSLFSTCGRPIGATCATATGVNASDQVVGSAGVCGSGGDRFLWQNGTMYVANDLVSPSPSGMRVEAASARHAPASPPTIQASWTRNESTSAVRAVVRWGRSLPRRSLVHRPGSYSESDGLLRISGTGHPRQGRSCGCRSYRSWICWEMMPHTGQAAVVVVASASNVTAVPSRTMRRTANDEEGR